MQSRGPKRRKHIRIKAKIKAECWVGATVFRANTLDLHPMGISIFTRPNLPAQKNFKLVCILDSGTRAEFFVATIYRKKVQTRKGPFLRLGLVVLKLPPNASAFFEELAHLFPPGMDPTATEATPSREDPPPGTPARFESLPLEVFATVGDELHPCLGMCFQGDQLGILAPDNFPSASNYQLNVSHQLMDEITIDLRETGRMPHREAKDGRFLLLTAAVVSGCEELTSFLQRHGIARPRAQPGGEEPRPRVEPVSEAVTEPLAETAFDEPTAPLALQTRNRATPSEEPGARAPAKMPTNPEPPEPPTIQATARIPTNPGTPERALFQPEPNRPTNPGDPNQPFAVKSKGDHPEDPTAADLDKTVEDLSSLISPKKYQFEKRLGKGGFAEVYLVKDLALDRHVAMKILSAKYADSYELSQRFIAEAQIAAKFHHSNIALVYEVGVFEANHYQSLLSFPENILAEYPNRMAYFTMQYIEGRTLAEINKNEGRLGQFQTLQILYGVGKALEFAHQKGVVHRDIKPENIMVTYDEQVLVTDFGIAKILMDQHSHAPQPELETTTGRQTVGFMGTPHYVSPEQAEGEPVDGRSDIYSLGVTAYEMLTGNPPFLAERWIQILTMHIQEAPKPLRELDPEIHPNTAEFVHRCLEKKPENRFQSATQLLDTLSNLTRILQIDPFKIQAQEEVDDDARELVKDLFVHFARSFKTIGTYPEHHEMVQKSAKALHEKFETYFKRFERMDLEIDSMRIIFQRMSVYQEDQKETSLCFNLFRDGIRSLSFFRGLPPQELKKLLLQLYVYVHDRQVREKDSVTLLFQMGLQFVDFEYVDSFYEGHNHNLELKKIEAQVRQIPTWNVETLMKSGVAVDRLMPFFEHIHATFKEEDWPKLAIHFEELGEPEVRKEAVRIILGQLPRESSAEAADHLFRLLEEMLKYSIREQNLQLPLFILQNLASQAESEPEEDPHGSRQGWYELRERLSGNEFLNTLVDMFFNLSREFKNDIRALCHYLDRSIALPNLFQQFKEAREEWKIIFLCDLCVALCETSPVELIEMAKGLGDSLTATLIHALRGQLETLPKSVFASWAANSGTKTRKKLVHELIHLERTDTLQFIKVCALDTDAKYHQSRQLAWKYFTEHNPAEFAKVAKRFCNPRILNNLSVVEKKHLFLYIQSAPPSGALQDFLIGLVNGESGFGHAQLETEDRKKAALALKKTATPEGLAVIKKMSRKIIGNRELIQYCKRLVGGP